MEKRTKVALGCVVAVAGTCVLGFAGMVVLGLIVGPQPKREPVAAEPVDEVVVAEPTEAVAEPEEPASEQVAAEEADPVRLALPGCETEDLDSLASTARLAQPMPPYEDAVAGRAGGLVVLRGPVVDVRAPIHSDPGDEAVLLIATEGEDRDLVWVNVERSCVLDVGAGDEAVAIGGWMGLRAVVEDGERRVYPRAQAQAVVPPQWWDGRYRSWLEARGEGG